MFYIDSHQIFFSSETTRSVGQFGHEKPSEHSRGHRLFKLSALGPKMAPPRGPNVIDLLGKIFKNLLL